jgi:hypothetical protein
MAQKPDGPEQMGGQHDVVQTVAHQHPVDVQQPQQLRGTEHAKFAHWMEETSRFADHRPPAQAFDPRGQSVGVFAQEVHGAAKMFDRLARRQHTHFLLQILAAIARQDIASPPPQPRRPAPETAEAMGGGIADNPRQLFFPVDVQPRQNGLEFPAHGRIAFDGNRVAAAADRAIVGTALRACHEFAPRLALGRSGHPNAVRLGQQIKSSPQPLGSMAITLPLQRGQTGEHLGVEPQIPG